MRDYFGPNDARVADGIDFAPAVSDADVGNVVDGVVLDEHDARRYIVLMIKSMLKLYPRSCAALYRTMLAS